MSTPPGDRRGDARDEREVEEGVRRFVAIVESTLAHVRANRLATARYSLSPTMALRVLAGVPVEHLRATVGAIARMQAHLSEDGMSVENATRELEDLLAFWNDGRKDGRE